MMKEERERGRLRGCVLLQEMLVTHMMMEDASMDGGYSDGGHHTARRGRGGVNGNRLLLHAEAPGSDSVSYGVYGPPITCSVCGKQIFGRNKKQRYQYHMLSHSGQRPHSCPYCNYKATLKFTLNRHVRNVHRDLVLLPPASDTSGASMAPFTASAGRRDQGPDASSLPPAAAPATHYDQQS